MWPIRRLMCYTVWNEVIFWLLWWPLQLLQVREEKAEVVEPRAGGKLPYVLQLVWLNYIASILQLWCLILWTSEVDQIRHESLYHSWTKKISIEFWLNIFIVVIGTKCTLNQSWWKVIIFVLSQMNGILFCLWYYM